MPYLVDIQTSFPKNYYDQTEIIDALKKMWHGKLTNLARVDTIHKNVQVQKRHLALPLDEYFTFESFDQKNKKFISVATQLATSAVQKLINQNNIEPTQISSLWSNTVTGFAIPSIEARVMNRIKFASNTKRVPIMGLGCMAGVAGINRVADYLKSHPTESVIFVSVELCSLTFQLEDLSVANLVSTGLFGDGSAAVLMVGDEHPLKNKAKLKWLASESIFFPDSEETMGWDVGSDGLKIVLSKSVPEVVEKELLAPTLNFLTRHRLKLENIDSFMTHPGGPKVLMAMEKLFEIPEPGLIHSWNSLAQNGNMSSVSVLDIIKRNIETDTKPTDNYALGIAMGPGFSAELGLYQWM